MDREHSPLRDVAQNPDAFTAYLADVQRVLLDIGDNLEVLARETRVHCRHTRIEGDRWYSARLRALPVEKTLRDVLKHLHALTDGLEKSTHKRHAHDETVKEVTRKRRENALEKARKKQAVLQPAPNPAEGVPTDPNPGYGGPTSIYDLGREKSA
ncbi:hypothetical protein [Streptomyces mangrovi]|uniref:hypothetical protein n=1 Tax=Streptomyces mangrovi TaxID=1206892 RepID=UPI00399CA54B